MKQYRELDSSVVWGRNLEDVVKLLQDANKLDELVSINFNGTLLYSDTVTMDDAYKEITGRTKSEFDEMIENNRLEQIKREAEHKEKIPQLELEWIKKGHDILAEDKWEFWDKIVPIRLRDLYEGMELGMCLDIIKILNEDEDMERAKQEINNQGHSGMSFGLICSMLTSFHEKGEEFVEYVR